MAGVAPLGLVMRITLDSRRPASRSVRDHAVEQRRRDPVSSKRRSNDEIIGERIVIEEAEPVVHAVGGHRIHGNVADGGNRSVLPVSRPTASAQLRA
jgi:hypothetical protein